MYLIVISEAKLVASRLHVQKSLFHSPSNMDSLKNNQNENNEKNYFVSQYIFQKKLLRFLSFVSPSKSSFFEKNFLWIVFLKNKRDDSQRKNPLSEKRIF